MLRLAPEWQIKIFNYFHVLPTVQFSFLKKAGEIGITGKGLEWN